MLHCEIASQRDSVRRSRLAPHRRLLNENYAPLSPPDLGSLSYFLRFLSLRSLDIALRVATGCVFLERYIFPSLIKRPSWVFSHSLGKKLVEKISNEIKIQGDTSRDADTVFPYLYDNRCKKKQNRRSRP